MEHFPEPGSGPSDELGAGTGSRARRLAKEAEPIQPPGSGELYSCTGFMLLGLGLERYMDTALDELFRDRVAGPLGIEECATFTPPRSLRGSCAPTEWDRWRGRRMQGEVHDENAWLLGGVAGNAGLFGTEEAVVTLVEHLANEPGIGERDRQGRTRGLGVQLKPGADYAEALHPGGTRMSEASFGHTGFTGTSFWVDPVRELIVVALTNRVYYGRDGTDAAIRRFRIALHDAAAEIWDG
jgi:CubicO group peptidase (beta-lactamase class C family)